MVEQEHHRVPDHSVTGLVLAGGQGCRMGGVDKGLQPFLGQPLAHRALQRLHQQQGKHLAGCMLNANRCHDIYATWGVPVISDTLAGFPGPLAGVLSGLMHCPTPYLLTVPCDSPFFPLDLLERLARDLEDGGADLAVACAHDHTGRLRAQSVFVLLPVHLQKDLASYLQGGGRQVMAWLERHTVAYVSFDRPTDHPFAFSNTNTLDELQALERQQPHR